MAAALALCAFILLGAVFVVHPAAVLCGVCAVWGLCCVGFILFGACAAWSLSSGEFILFGVHAPAPSLGRFLSCKHLVLYDLVWLSGRWNELLITVLFFNQVLMSGRKLMNDFFSDPLWGGMFEGPWIVFPLTEEILFKNYLMSVSIIFSSTLFETSGFCLLHKH